MTTKCVIAFENNPSKVFYSGQLLKGSVTLTLPNEQKVRGIYLNITGYAYARWSEGSGRNKNTYTGKESYLNERTDFVSANNSHGKSLNTKKNTIIPNTFALCYIKPLLLCVLKIIFDFHLVNTYIIFNVNCQPNYRHHLKVIMDIYDTVQL